MKMILIYFLLLAVTLLLMSITFNSLLNSYYLEKHHAEVNRMELQKQLDFLDQQLSRPQDKTELDLLKIYDQKYGTNLQAEIKKNYISSSTYLEKQNILTNFHALRDYKNQQIQNIKDRSSFSYIPEWQVLILGVLGIIATKIINFLMDYIKEEICSYFKNRKNSRKNIE